MERQPIIEALETSASVVYRVRKQLVEEGFEAVLSRKPPATHMTLRRREPSLSSLLGTIRAGAENLQSRGIPKSGES